MSSYVAIISTGKVTIREEVEMPSAMDVDARLKALALRLRDLAQRWRKEGRAGLDQFEALTYEHCANELDDVLDKELGPS
jgi:hypothetical protein